MFCASNDRSRCVAGALAEADAAHAAASNTDPQEEPQPLAPAFPSLAAGVLMIDPPTIATSTPAATSPQATGSNHRSVQGGMQVYPMSGASTFDSADTSTADSALAALSTPVMVLDEIDAGIGPRLGSSVGRMLHAMAAGGQTLCVSHVPQARTPCCCFSTILIFCFAQMMRHTMLW